MAIMKLGIIGLGRMGSAVAQRVLSAHYEVVGYDVSSDSCAEVARYGAQIADSVADVAKHARIMWLMVPAGELVDQVITQLRPHLNAGDILIDGGNSKFTDSMRRAAELKNQGIAYLDCGTSGGLLGREVGFALMVGGDEDAYKKVLPLLKSIAASDGVGYVGPSGAGHYVKMVHNGIEYAMLQAYAEGFDLIKHGSFKKDDLDLAEITYIWQHGSVIRSWLLDLAHDVFVHDQKLEHISGEVAEGGTGAWTVEDAHKHNVQVTLIEESLKARAQSRKTGGNYMTKIIAMLRKKFGGHAVKSK